MMAFPIWIHLMPGFVVAGVSLLSLTQRVLLQRLRNAQGTMCPSLINHFQVRDELDFDIFRVSVLLF